MTTNNKTSLLVPYQLPEFIRDNPDYANFELFIKAYYEWMEENGGVTEGSKNLLNYKDIDRTTNEFLDYYVNDFLPYFPKEILVDKEKALKVARQLYQSKGTLSSYKFLFRILYDSDVEVFFTKDAVLKASDGTWYVAKSLKLSSLNPNLLEIDNLRLFGETTKSIATVETSVIAGNKTEVFISNIERLFQSGEFVRVVDNSNQTVLFDGQPLRAKIVGQISQVRIDPQNRGLLYEVGDPVIVYDGLSSNTGIGAIAEVGTTTAGAIQRINVIDGGYGYTSNSILRITNAPGANATIASLNPAANSRANVVLVPVNEITLAQYTTIGNAQYSFFSSNPTANANTTLANSFTFTSFSTFPISSVFVNNGGGGIRQVPAVTALSVFPTDVSGNTASLTGLGMLGPIQIANGGKGYVANDTIVFSGGSGIGAYANVETVNATGAITSVVYVSNPQHPYPSGGIGYRNTNLPTLSVLSSNVQASNASLYVPGILGDGATFSVVVDRAGSVTTIRVTDFGEDYIATPNVSLKVQDILVSNVSITNLPIKGDYIYQGGSINTASYLARYDSITSVTTDEDPTLSKYNLRVFNYKSNPNTQLQLTIQDKNMNFVMANTSLNDRYNSSGYKNYGDGNAKGFAQFLNGLNISQGQYLNTQGHPSSFGVLQNENYNNFTYQITVEKEIEKYRDVLLNLLHPTGMKLLGRYALKSNNDFYFHGIEALNQGKTLADYTGYPGSSVTMTADFTNKSNNILKFNDLAGANIAGFILANSTIEVTPINGPNIISQIVSVNTVSNTVTLATNTWLTFGNVAFVSTRTNSNAINILSLTGAYDIVNNRQYSNTTYPLKDIVYAGDRILVGSNTSNSRTVSSVDYENGIIYLTSNANLTSTNTRLTVNRTLSAQTSVRIYGPLGQQYIPQLTTESGDILTTEAGEIILLG